MSELGFEKKPSSFLDVEPGSVSMGPMPAHSTNCASKTFYQKFSQLHMYWTCIVFSLSLFPKQYRITAIDIAFVLY
jgi:hypothetical protein